jgi:hypothetical protein
MDPYCEIRGGDGKWGNLENSVSPLAYARAQKNKKNFPVNKNPARKNKKTSLENVCPQIANVALTT